MIKKVLIAGLFLGGGYYFINKILPNFTKDEFNLDTMSIEERLALEEKLARERAEKIRQAFIRKVGTADPEKLKDIKTWMFAPDLYDSDGNYKLSPQQKADLKKRFEGLNWNPNSLESYSGLKGVTFFPMFG